MGLYADDGLCHASEPGTFGRECERPARWLGWKTNSFASGYCDYCRAHGFEARAVRRWEPLAPLPVGWTWERVEAERLARGLPPHMVPSTRDGASWITIAEARGRHALSELLTALRPFAFCDEHNPPPGVALADWQAAVVAARAAVRYAQL